MKSVGTSQIRPQKNNLRLNAFKTKEMMIHREAEKCESVEDVMPGAERTESM